MCFDSGRDVHLRIIGRVVDPSAAARWPYRGAKDGWNRHITSVA
jgi:hypothetical protein